MFGPEHTFLGHVVRPLVAPVAVHSVGVKHQSEICASTLHGIHQKQGILEVDIVIAGAVGKPQTAGTVCGVYALLRGIAENGGPPIAIRILLRGAHIPLGVMRIIQPPVIYATAGNAAAEIFRIA